jgi:hypothetical protein
MRTLLGFCAFIGGSTLHFIRNYRTCVMVMMMRCGSIVVRMIVHEHVHGWHLMMPRSARGLDDSGHALKRQSGNQ